MRLTKCSQSGRAGNSLLYHNGGAKTMMSEYARPTKTARIGAIRRGIQEHSWTQIFLLFAGQTVTALGW